MSCQEQTAAMTRRGYGRGPTEGESGHRWDVDQPFSTAVSTGENNYVCAAQACEIVAKPDVPQARFVPSSETVC